MRTLAGPPEFGDGFGVEHLVARVIELVAGAGFGEPLRQFVGGLCAGLRVGEKPRGGGGCDGDRPGAAGLERDPYRLGSRLQLRLTDTVGCDIGAGGQGRQRQDVDQNFALEFEAAATRYA